MIPRPAPERDAVLDWLNAVITWTDWSPSKLAKEAGLAPSTVNRILAGADHMLSTTTIGRIEAAAFRRIRERVARGELDWSFDSPDSDKERMVKVRETDPRNKKGAGGDDTWGFPERWFRFTYGPRPADDCRVLAVEDDAMWPDYRVGDRVLVDCTVRGASPAGVYPIWDGVSWTLRHLELLPGETPETVSVRARNPEYMNREARLAGIEVMGRVIGMWRRV